MKKLAAILLSLCLLAAVPALAADYSDVFTNFDKRDSWTEAVTVTFSDSGVLVNGSGVSVDGTTAYISQPGIYMLSGSCQNGQIVVEVTKEDKVQLVLGGLTLACQDSAPLYVISADKVSLTLAPGSVNSFTDGAVYSRPFEKAPNACVCSRDDLTINGSGELTVNGQNNNGIGTKNDLRILGGAISVTAPKNALKGNDSVAIADGNLTLNAGKDAIKADNAEDAGKGYVYIAGGVLDITAGDDAIQAQQDVTITGGSIQVSAEGKTVNSKGTQDVASGIISQK
ncbi:MAG: carbohydrate-binding domain-containing protein [Clostridia bacterium]|nr:carbohydrate-binding domain-containing protein [Clostridia bacterium]